MQLYCDVTHRRRFGQTADRSRCSRDQKKKTFARLALVVKSFTGHFALVIYPSRTIPPFYMVWNIPFSPPLSPIYNVNRVTTCLENLEMSRKLTVVKEMSGILLKIREMSGNRQRKNIVREKLPKTVYCKLHICVHTGI